MFDLYPFDRLGKYPELFSPRKEIDDFENRFFGRPLPLLRTDIRETEGEYVLESELAGYRSDEIRVSIKNHLLTITAERSDETEETAEGGYLRRERTRGRLCRSFDISGLPTEGIRASFRDGILTVTLPKPTHPKDSERDVRID